MPITPWPPSFTINNRSQGALLNVAKTRTAVALHFATSELSLQSLHLLHHILHALFALQFRAPVVFVVQQLALVELLSPVLDIASLASVCIDVIWVIPQTATPLAHQR